MEAADPLELPEEEEVLALLPVDESVLEAVALVEPVAVRALALAVPVALAV